MVKLISERTPAKINLFLRVVGKRADGYHELDSLFVPVTLYDYVSIEQRPAAAPAVALTIHRAQSAAGELPTDNRNLAVRAASAFMAEFGLSASVLIGLQKEIPIAAGLGGGSSDAAAVLRLMAELNGIDAPQRIAKLALSIGADVPFFLRPAPARVGGIGERITPLKPLKEMAFVIAAPPIEVTTAEVFGALKQDAWSGTAPEDHLRAIAAGKITAAMVVNDLESAAAARWPEIGALKAIVQAAGPIAASMTGSGGAVFGVFRDIAHAHRAAGEIERRAPDARVFAVSALSDNHA